MLECHGAFTNFPFLKIIWRFTFNFNCFNTIGRSEKRWRGLAFVWRFCGGAVRSDRLSSIGDWPSPFFPPPPPPRWWSVSGNQFDGCECRQVRLHAEIKSMVSSIVWPHLHAPGIANRYDWLTTPDAINGFTRWDCTRLGGLDLAFGFSNQVILNVTTSCCWNVVAYIIPVRIFRP